MQTILSFLIYFLILYASIKCASKIFYRAETNFKNIEAQENFTVLKKRLDTINFRFHYLM